MLFSGTSDKDKAAILAALGLKNDWTKAEWPLELAGLVHFPRRSLARTGPHRGQMGDGHPVLDEP
jgi:hypothetical protein